MKISGYTHSEITGQYENSQTWQGKGNKNKRIKPLKDQ